MTLYAASVPVFLHYLGQARGWAARGDLAATLGDGFPAGQQLATAAGFALRVAYPLAGRAVPDLPDGLAVLARMDAVAAALHALSEDEFDGAAARMIRHRAGFADLTQTGGDFLYLYGLPNFFFHLTMAYAAMKVAGLPLGKTDFDGFHHYPPGFSFAVGR